MGSLDLRIGWAKNGKNETDIRRLENQIEPIIGQFYGMKGFLLLLRVVLCVEYFIQLIPRFKTPFWDDCFKKFKEK